MSFKTAEEQRLWKAANREKVLAYRRREATMAELRADAEAARGGACEECGATYGLHFHHTEGDGKREREGGYRRAMYRGIRDGRRPDMKLLCDGCHLAAHR